MRFSLSTAANAAAWAVIVGMACGAVLLVARLGPVGLILLGLFTLVVCTSVGLDQDTPTWGAQVFKARMTSRGSPEQRAAAHEERRASLSPLRFYRWCGIILVAVGAAGFAWQQLL